MKRIFYLFALLPILSFSQIKVDDNNNLFFEKVNEVNLPKEVIKSNVNEWIATNFNDANNVIKMNTEDKIIAKGLFLIPNNYNGFTANYEIHYDLITDFKDNRYKILIQNLNLKYLDYMNMPLKKDFISKDEYKLMSLKIANKMGGRYVKAMKKIFESDNFLEMYDQAKEMYSKNIQDVEIKLISMAENINSSVQSSLEKSDW